MHTYRCIGKLGAHVTLLHITKVSCCVGVRMTLVGLPPCCSVLSKHPYCTISLIVESVFHTSEGAPLSVWAQAGSRGQAGL